MMGGCLEVGLDGRRLVELDDGRVVDRFLELEQIDIVGLDGVEKPRSL